MTLASISGKQQDSQASLEIAENGRIEEDDRRNEKQNEKNEKTNGKEAPDIVSVLLSGQRKSYAFCTAGNYSAASV